MKGTRIPSAFILWLVRRAHSSEWTRLLFLYTPLAENTLLFVATKTSKKRSLPPSKEGNARGMARARVDSNVIPNPPPRPMLLSEYDAAGLDLNRTKPVSFLFMDLDDECTALDQFFDARINDKESLIAIDNLERERWAKRIASTPLPPTWLGIHTGWMERVIFTEGSRFIDHLRLPEWQTCSCGALITCVIKHPRRGAIRWHKVCYIPKCCSSCSGLLFAVDEDSDAEEDEELPDAHCHDCGDCYKVCAKKQRGKSD